MFNGINVIDFPGSQEPFAVTIEVNALCRAVLDEELAIQIVALDERHEEVVLQVKAVSRWHRGRPTHAVTPDLGRTIFDKPGDYK